MRSSATPHDYLWILSRTPVLPDEQMNAARNAAAANGFDVAKLVPTPQNSAVGNRTSTGPHPSMRV